MNPLRSFLFRLLSSVVPFGTTVSIAAEEDWRFRVGGAESALVENGRASSFGRAAEVVVLSRDRGVLLRFPLDKLPLASSVNATVWWKVKVAPDGLSPCLTISLVEGEVAEGEVVKPGRRLAEVALKPGSDGPLSLPVTEAFLSGLPGKNVTFLIEVLAPAEAKVLLSGVPALALAKQADFAFDTDQWLAPLWSASTIFDETVLPVARDWEAAAGQLKFEPAEILAVRDYGLGTTYVAGRDYIVEGRTIKLTEGSTIPFLTREQLFPGDRDAKPGTMPALNGGYLASGEGTFFTDRQIAITYRTDEVWPGPVPAPADDLLPRTFEKLQRGQALKVVVFGDSISRGGSASGWVRRTPFLPPWADLVRSRLASHFGSEIDLYNLSLGGMHSDWGRQHASAFVAPLAPDLVILGFGMNDAGANAGFTANQLKENLEAIMAEVREVNPQAEFLLIMTFQPNPAWRDLGEMVAYRDTLRGMEGPGVAVADLWEMHGEWLAGKSYEDMTSNNVNHPNDFIVRLYAQVVLARLGVSTTHKLDAAAEPAGETAAAASGQ